MAAQIFYRVFRQDEMIADAIGAFGFLDRLKGLLGSDRLTAGAGLWLRPGGSVHTLGMGFPIDVLFLDGQATIVDARSEVPPGRFCLAPWSTGSTLELWPGAIEQLGLSRGTRLVFRPAPR